MPPNDFIMEWDKGKWRWTREEISCDGAVEWSPMSCELSTHHEVRVSFSLDHTSRARAQHFFCSFFPASCLQRDRLHMCSGFVSCSQLKNFLKNIYFFSVHLSYTGWVWASTTVLFQEPQVMHILASSASFSHNFKGFPDSSKLNSIKLA